MTGRQRGDWGAEPLAPSPALCEPLTSLYRLRVEGLGRPRVKALAFRSAIAFITSSDRRCSDTDAYSGTVADDVGRSALNASKLLRIDPGVEVLMWKQRSEPVQAADLDSRSRPSDLDISRS